MLRDDDVVLVISNAPDLLLAKRIAHVLVEDGLAACVNLGAPGLSIYQWQGEVEGAEEIPIHVKTTYARQLLPGRCVPAPRREWCAGRRCPPGPCAPRTRCARAGRRAACRLW